jgi:hypothetical protein
LFVSHDGGAKWERIGANGALPTTWSLTIDPVDPNILFAGTRPREFGEIRAAVWVPN